MQIGSIVTLKKGIEIPVQFMIMAMMAGVQQMPAHGNPYVVEDIHEFLCDHCEEKHLRIGIDGVGSPMTIWEIEWFEELAPPQEVVLENIVENTVTH